MCGWLSSWPVGRVLVGGRNARRRMVSSIRLQRGDQCCRVCRHQTTASADCQTAAAEARRRTSVHHGKNIMIILPVTGSLLRAGRSRESPGGRPNPRSADRTRSNGPLEARWQTTWNEESRKLISEKFRDCFCPARAGERLPASRWS